jgi:hypothetical protein
LIGLVEGRSTYASALISIDAKRARLRILPLKS